MVTVIRNFILRILFPGPSAPAKANGALDQESPPSYHLSEAPPLPSSPPHKGRPRRFPWRDFIYHSLALGMSAITLATIVLVVRIFDNNPPPVFNSMIMSSLNLNSILSWLSAISKLTLMIPVAECIGQMRWILFGNGRRKLSDLDLIDGASRDAFGAMGWIFKFRGGFLVHLGAALVAVSIAFDPAIQQLVSYENRLAVDTSQVSLLSVNPSYTPTRGFNRGLVLDRPRAVLLGATSSMMGGGLTTDYTCPSGNCTFPVATSVGTCQVCDEITDQLERNCTTLTSTNTFCRNGDCFTSGQLCTYTFNGTSVGGGNTFLEVLAQPLNSTPIGTQVSIPAERLALTALYIQPDNSTKNTQDLPTTPGYVPPGSGHVARAFQCGISFCEQKFQASVSNGVYKETLINSTSISAFVFPIPDLEGLSDTFNKVLAISPTGETNVSVAALYALGIGFSSSLSGNATVPTDAVLAPGEVSDFHRAMYIKLLSDDFGVVMASMVTSMSVAIRNAGTGAQKLQGEVNTLQIYVRAHWAWLAIPTTLWVLALILMTAVIIKTRGNRHGPLGWLGNSQVAGIFVGLDDHVRRDVDARGVAYTGDAAQIKSLGGKLKLKIAPVAAIGEGISIRFTKGGDS